MAEKKMNAEGGSPAKGNSKGTDAKKIAEENKTNGTVDMVNGIKRISY